MMPGKNRFPISKIFIKISADCLKSFEYVRILNFKCEIERLFNFGKNRNMTRQG